MRRPLTRQSMQHTLGSVPAASAETAVAALLLWHLPTLGKHSHESICYNAHFHTPQQLLATALLLRHSHTAASAAPPSSLYPAQALYRGNGANVARLIPDVAFKFAVHDQFKLMFAPQDGSPPGVQEKMAAGAATGMFGLLCAHAQVCMLWVHTHGMPRHAGLPSWWSTCSWSLTCMTLQNCAQVLRTDEHDAAAVYTAIAKVGPLCVVGANCRHSADTDVLSFRLQPHAPDSRHNAPRSAAAFHGHCLMPAPGLGSGRHTKLVQGHGHVFAWCHGLHQHKLHSI